MNRVKQRPLPFARVKRFMWAQEWEQALRLLEQFLSRSPDHPLALSMKGHILEFQAVAGRGTRARRKVLLEAAGRAYRRALRHVDHPVGRAAIMRDLGDHLHATGQTQKALATLERGLRLLADMRSTRSVLAWREELLLSRFVACRSGTRRQAAARQEWLDSKAENERRWGHSRKKPARVPRK